MGKSPLPLAPETVVTQLIDLDDRLNAWVSDLPPYYTIRHIFCSSLTNVYGSYFDVYKDHEAAQTLNSFRSVRKMVNDHILKIVPQCKPGFAYRRIVAAAVIRDICIDLCASIPYLLDRWRSADDKGLAPTIGSGNTVCWPLYVIADDNSGLPPGMKEWACKQLFRIHETTGIQQAKSMADLLERDVSSPS